MREGWTEVSAEHPCKLCGSRRYCRVGLVRIHCMKLDHDLLGNAGKPCKAGWMYPKSDEHKHVPLPPTPKRVSDAEMRERWEPLALQCAKTAIGELPRLAVELGVSVNSLEWMQVGYREDLGWTLPERNELGWIVGVQRRTPNGKRACKGSRRGLSYVTNWQYTKGPIIIVEGPTDVCAGLDMDMCVIGRPSNIGGVEMLAKLLKPFETRPIVVLGENDWRKVDGHEGCKGCAICFPGQYGAIATAKALSTRLKRSVLHRQPPLPWKDLREVLHNAPETTQGSLVRPHSSSRQRDSRVHRVESG
jgi:hypothetical protein